MDINAAFPSKFVKAADLAGQDVTVSISRFAMEAVDDNGELKPVLYFQGMQKGLVVNRTNAFVISDLLGTTETDHWVGRAVTVYPAKVPFGSKMVDGIRVRPWPPQFPNGQQQTQPAQPFGQPQHVYPGSTSAQPQQQFLPQQPPPPPAGQQMTFQQPQPQQSSDPQPQPQQPPTGQPPVQF